MKRLFRRIVAVLLALIGLAIFVYCWLFFPVLTGWVAKSSCSAVFVSHRDPATLKGQDYWRFMFRHIDFHVNYADSSVTASIAGLARRTAVYRQGLGATLLSGTTAHELRQQPITLAAPPRLSQDMIPWPQGDLHADTILPDVDTAKLRLGVDAAFYDTTYHDSTGTRALIVLYKGRIVAERYAAGFNAQMPLLGWSMTKSITNALLGVLVRQGRLDIHAPVPVAAWQNDDRRKITYVNLMQMTSGLRFHWVPIAPGDLTNMLFKEKDMATFVEGLPLKHPPGTVFHYSDGNAILLSKLIRDKLGDSVYYRFPYEQLFDKIGMWHTTLEPDAGGTFVGCSYCYATARDWARFGLLYLRDGVWNGERLLPEGWVRWSGTASGIHNMESREGEYGALWWVNATGRPDSPGWRFMPDVPADCFSAMGLDGQNIFVIPSKDLVVVRLGMDRGHEQHPNILLYHLLKAFP